MCALVALLLLAPPPGTVIVKVDRTRVGMGRTVTVTARAIRPDSTPAARMQLLPYVNGRRWGPHEIADAAGRATWHLPLPTPGTAAIQVQARALPGQPDDWWIWAGRPKDQQTVYLQRAFTLPAPASAGELWVAVDDGSTVWLNGRKLSDKGGWHDCAPLRLDAGSFRAGENVLSAEARNGFGPAGFILRLTVTTPRGTQTILTDDTWRGFLAQPPGWPERAASGEPALALARADANVTVPVPWPSVPDTRTLIAGTPLPAGAVVSKPVTVIVQRRALQRPPADPAHLIAMQWEEWFTPHNCWWQTAQAVPVMGFYDSMLPEVARQHLIWFIESGVDCVIADWSNNIWNAKEWAPGVGTQELIQASHVMLREMAKMRAEGCVVPRMSFLTGIDYERPEGPRVADAQLDFIWREYVTNPAYKGLWQEFEGKPLILALDCGATYVHDKITLDRRFTVRYQGAQQDHTRTHELGHWSWMDHQEPSVTMKDGQAEGMTVCIGSFGPGGWLAADARGRRNGATFIEDWRHALERRPAFLQVHQFQEFAGQAEGQPVGQPPVYVDIYSPALSDDLEPTSLTAPAYRGTGGWGYFYLNLLRALVDLYRQPTPETTVLAVSQPLRSQVVTGDRLTVRWVTAGAPAAVYRVELNGKPAARVTTGDHAEVDLARVPDGPAVLRLVAEGTRTRYRMSWTEDSLPLAKPEPAAVEVPFTVRRTVH
ncbi:MAG: hypothetical protein HYU66_13460 [Armatimonadetes bacterium]|nr:hypothetical protein [Armatimonadota bacterium]